MFILLTLTKNLLPTVSGARSWMGHGSRLVLERPVSALFELVVVVVKCEAKTRVQCAKAVRV